MILTGVVGPLSDMCCLHMQLVFYAKPGVLK